MAKTNIDDLFKEAEVAKPLLLDEVAHAFVSGLRVESWETLGEMFGGHKIGKIYSYVLELLEKNIYNNSNLCVSVPATVLKDKFPEGVK